MAEFLFWPALLCYGEAAVGYFGEARNPGRPGRLATWGVRLGWFAQTGLLVAQAARGDGFPWGTWASSLDLFVWLVVSAYLIWGCRTPYRLLGLAVMPLAVALLVAARAGGGTGTGVASRYSTVVTTQGALAHTCAHFAALGAQSIDPKVKPPPWMWKNAGCGPSPLGVYTRRTISPPSTATP